jgi:signal transduction histidine kinase
MTIKRRLLLTGFSLLLALLILGAVAVNIAWDMFKEAGEDTPGLLSFTHLMGKVDGMAKETAKKGNEERLIKAARKFNRKYSGAGAALAVFKGDTQLADPPLAIPRDVLALAFAAESGGLVSTGKNAAYIQKAAGFTLALYNPAFNPRLPEFDERPEFIFILLLLTVAVVFVTVIFYNIALSRFVFRPIAKTLDTLQSGAGRIRDGDLAYRVRHRGKDEFLPVCEAFNEMAERLMDSVQAKQKDEESRRQLIAGISHDLRTPLTSIKAYAESLAGNVADTGAKRDKYLNTIMMKADDMEKIIRQLFLFSKLDLAEFPVNMETVGVNGELAAITEALKDEFEKTGLDIAARTGGPELFVRLDTAQFRNALYNILDNSRKYKTGARGKALITSSAAGGMVLITVSDDGPGVPACALEKIFDVFYRCDAARSAPEKGSGLGLAITAKIMRHLGGFVRAENNPGGGLSVIISLPAAEGGAQKIYEEKNPDN